VSPERLRATNSILSRPKGIGESHFPYLGRHTPRSNATVAAGHIGQARIYVECLVYIDFFDFVFMEGGEAIRWNGVVVAEFKASGYSRDRLQPPTLARLTRP
jgi:hypothetical protein